MSFFINLKSDKKLAEKISQGDNKAWNTFVNKYSDYILGNILKWCKSTCRIISEPTQCSAEQLLINKTNKNNRLHHISNSKNSYEKTCDEGLELYVFIFNSLRNKVSKFQGKSSLKTFITACLNFIYSDYFIAKHGKINIPTALKDTNDIDKKVYKVLCRSSSLENAIEKLEKLGISKIQSEKSFKKIVELLENQGEGKVWQHLYSQFSRNKPVEHINNNFDDENKDKDIPVYNNKFENKEILEFFIQSFNKLSSKHRRLLKLKFEMNLSTNDIFLKYGNILDINKENDIYSELDKSIKELINNIKDNYTDNFVDKNVDVKGFKESLYDIFKLMEV